MPMHIVQNSYGGPEVLEAVDVPRPSAAEGELLVRVTAASLNPVDGKTRRGQGASGALGDFPISVSSSAR